MELSSQCQEFNNTVYYDPLGVLKHFDARVMQVCQWNTYALTTRLW